ncbi:hypothetical protein B0J13DRAFT_534048 [Dactylonectria estremocensis]|uniref:Major facilitator superfamily (MFS) profile domain-containing protein n=1 Tax=Dactylonectria estremocensis TaxID=1079267 RepID=A0A9P9I939_9HYPO|nr:hypothetical protein B0J13DRAFT_534048 [Dactylonectria estremocensis]
MATPESNAKPSNRMARPGIRFDRFDRFDRCLSLLPVVFLFVGMLFANESPRFLAQKTPEKALAVLAKLRGLPMDHPYIRNEMDSISAQLEEERALAANNSGLTPTIFKSVGMSSSASGLLATGVYGIVNIVSCAIFILFVTDSLGRRKSLLWTGIVQGLALFYVGFFLRYSHPQEGSPPGAAGYVAIVAIYIFAAVYQFGWGPVEIPAARMRALQMGMATASQWLFNFVVAKSTLTMFATLGPNGFGTYFLYGSFCVSMVVFAWFFVPETKDMDELFACDNVRGKFIPTRLTRLEAERNAKVGEDKFEHLENA